MSYFKEMQSVLIGSAILFFCFFAGCSQTALGEEKISLAGQWNFKLDPDGVGMEKKWFSAALPDAAHLPGSLDEQGLGDKYTEKSLHHLTREYSYVGQAWFQKTVTIPDDWDRKRITLFLEKCHWETTAWVDGNYIGSLNSLSVPHVYDLSYWMRPGKHTLTVRVDNTLKIRIYHSSAEMKWTHEFSDEGQTNWNGIIGRIELRASEKVWVENIRTYPDLDKKKLRVNITVGNTTGESIKGDVSVDFVGTENKIAFSADSAKSEVDIIIPIKDTVALWDEFEPRLHELSVKVAASVNNENLVNERNIKIGLRKFGADGNRFVMNGRKLFLRGKVDSAIFPLTGYPPTDLNEWRRLLNIYKDYGINHLRFHSWVPVENAFIAADELGIMFQVEPPLWDGHGLVGNDAKVAGFVVAEVDRIVDAYGNHPSFCLMSMGNELGNHTNVFLEYLVDYLKEKDPRHLYTSTTHPVHLDRNDDYHVAAGTKKGVVRDIRPTGNFDNELQGLERPLISHELSQAAMYPDFKEIAKYTGPLKAYHLEHFRDTLKENGLIEMAEDYRLASGLHLVNIYKRYVEAQLRTANMAGFQMLDLQDYSGHGYAIIGVLDSFCDSKGLITPKQFRRFCCPTVPLVQMGKMVWTSDETFIGNAMVSHFGPSDIKGQKVSWTISNEQGKNILTGKFEPRDISTGSLSQLGEIKMGLGDVVSPSQLTVELSLDGTEYINSWKFWVYPKQAVVNTSDVIVASQWDEDAKEALESGKDVLLLSSPGKLKNIEKARWHPVFWAYRLFRQIQTMGALCRPEHSALAKFPTDIYADWQWHDLLSNSEGLVLDGKLGKIDPIVQFVPDFNLNKRLSLITELNAGKGKLIICTSNLENNLDNRPAAKALLKSILDYMNSDSFKPADRLSLTELDKLLEGMQTIKDQGRPADITKAVINVKAAVNAKAGVDAPWKTDLDKVITLDDEFGYSIDGKVWKDAGGATWHNTNLTVTVTCPVKFEGTFYAHFHDWSNQRREAALFFAGIDLGPISNYGGQGVWLKQAVTKEMTKNGQLRLDGRVTKGPNVVVSQIVLVPKESK